MSRSTKARCVRAVSAVVLVFGIALLTASAVAATDGGGTNSAGVLDVVAQVDTQNVPLHNNTSEQRRVPGERRPHQVVLALRHRAEQRHLLVRDDHAEPRERWAVRLHRLPPDHQERHPDRQRVRRGAGRKGADRPADDGLVRRHLARTPRRRSRLQPESRTVPARRPNHHRTHHRGTHHRTDHRGTHHRTDHRGTHHRTHDRGTHHRTHHRGTHHRTHDGATATSTSSVSPTSLAVVTTTTTTIPIIPGGVVVTAPPSPSGGLAFTGPNVPTGWLALIGALLVAAGIALAVFAQRRFA